MKKRSRIAAGLFLLLSPFITSCALSEDSTAMDRAVSVELSAAQASKASMAAAVTCYDFSSFAGAFAVGSVINMADAIISFHRFQWSNGMWTANGGASVDVSNWANGTPTSELRLNNIMVRVTPDDPAAGARYLYADLGGNVNFGVNGDFRNVGDLSALDGAVVGGCDISVTRTDFGPGGANHRGEVVITPQDGVTIERFGVGGQEFFIDDVCFW